MSDTPESGPPADDPEALRKDIEEKRRELGDTAADLAAKADVKSQIKEKVDARLLGVGVALLVLLLVLLRRRR